MMKLAHMKIDNISSKYEEELKQRTGNEINSILLKKKEMSSRKSLLIK
jgi:hypothetical protein